MTMDDSDVPVQASSPRESKTDAELAARFERGKGLVVSYMTKGGRGPAVAGDTRQRG
jgi:hypothetical protein